MIKNKEKLMVSKTYYTSGQFAKLAQVTLRTIRYYDKQNILKPTYVNESGNRFYTEQDFTRLQQILLLKYLGFPLKDIREMMITNMGPHRMTDSLNIQLKLIRDRMEQLQQVESAISNTINELETSQEIDWKHALEMIHLTSIEQSVRNQYRNASNVAARIQLHQLYSENQESWFPWIYDQCGCEESMKVLEIGCGDGSLWTASQEKLPEDIEIILSDISRGMLNDARRMIGSTDGRFTFQELDGHSLPFADETFDRVIANHVLFYCDDVSQVCREIQRVLKPDGIFICSTYSEKHMQEVNRLVCGFEEHIVLSADKLYQKFGRENGPQVLGEVFQEVVWKTHEDGLRVTDPEPLISYVLSCHGNQNQYILERYKEFVAYVYNKVGTEFYITKDAGIFICRK